MLIDNEVITMINVGFQIQATGFPGDFANVNDDGIVVSSLGFRKTGQMFVQRLTVHNSVYNPLLG